MDPDRVALAMRSQKSIRRTMQSAAMPMIKGHQALLSAKTVTKAAMSARSVVMQQFNAN
jgi:hypothetical protein